MKTPILAREASRNTISASLPDGETAEITIHITILPAAARHAATITPLYPDGVPGTASDEDDLADATWEDAAWQ